MSPRIGERIRELRRSAGLTKKELAASASIESEVLERMEKEDLNPPVGVLNQICSALGTRTGTVLDGAESAGPVLLHRASAGNEGSCDYSEANLNYHMLASQKNDRNMEPSIIYVEYAAEDLTECPSREGEEFIYVLEGEVILRYGKERYSLGSGDSIYLDSVVPHMLTTPASDKRAKVLSISYTPFM